MFTRLPSIQYAFIKFKLLLLFDSVHYTYLRSSFDIQTLQVFINVLSILSLGFIGRVLKFSGHLYMCLFLLIAQFLLHMYVYILNNFIVYLLLVTLDLCCCAGSSLVAVCGLFFAVASLVEHRLYPSRLQQLRHTGSRAQAWQSHRLSCSVACRIFPDWGLNSCSCIGR